MGGILVIGSTNMDIAAQMDHLPRPGETVGGARLFRAYGGKGANQAVAASRAGGSVTFVGCTGDDPNGQQMKSNLAHEGINVDHISIIPEIPSGAALIFVDDEGENCIAVAPGANNYVSTEIVDSVENLISQADLVLLQLEIPYETVQYICRIASLHNTKVLLNPAPAQELDKEVLRCVEYLILNETEIEVISGKKINGAAIQDLCRTISEWGPANIILTLGSKGSYIYNNKVQEFVEGIKVDVIDTTAAGDTFCGAFAAAVTKYEMEITDAVQFANASAALSVTKKGAQSSIPHLAETEAFLKRIKNTVSI